MKPLVALCQTWSVFARIIFFVGIKLARSNSAGYYLDTDDASLHSSHTFTINGLANQLQCSVLKSFSHKWFKVSSRSIQLSLSCFILSRWCLNKCYKSLIKNGLDFKYQNESVLFLKIAICFHFLFFSQLCIYFGEQAKILNLYVNIHIYYAVLEFNSLSLCLSIHSSISDFNFFYWYTNT